MAVPKRKVSKARRDKRRSNVWKLSMTHRVCSACGYYDGKQVIAKKEA